MTAALLLFSACELQASPPRLSLVALEYGPPGAQWRVVFGLPPGCLERSREAIAAEGIPLAFKALGAKWKAWPAAPAVHRGRPATAKPLRALGGRRRLNRVRVWCEGAENPRDAAGPATRAVEVDAAAWRELGAYMRDRLLTLLGRRGWVQRQGGKILRRAGVPRDVAFEARELAHGAGLALVVYRARGQ